MQVSALNPNSLTPEIIDQIIFEGITENAVKADCIMVLGSEKAATYRVPKALTLYQKGQAPTLLLCGGKKIPAGNDTMETEAQLMCRAAIDGGMPPTAILLEERSMTTKENILCGALVLDRAFRLCNVKRILLVTGDYHMRRSLAMARTYMPDWITFLPAPAPYQKTSRENWQLTLRGTELVTDEAKKIISYIREGSIPDFEIYGKQRSN